MRRSLSAAVVVVALLVGVLPASAATSATRMIARYDFEGGAAAVVDRAAKGHTMRLLSRHGGKLKVVAHGSGRAVQFPPKCSGSGCPRAVLQTPHRADLNPGRRPIVFGATVRLPARETTKGQNVIQKGYSARGSQYKLQIDGQIGRPSCVLVGVGSKRIHIVRSAVSVADGRWHALQCRRHRGSVTVVVDGAIRGVGRIPATLSLANKYPLSIGGKGVYADNDQFQGALDDVFVQIG